MNSRKNKLNNEIILIFNFHPNARIKLKYNTLVAIS